VTGTSHQHLHPYVDIRVVRAVNLGVRHKRKYPAPNPSKTGLNPILEDFIFL